MHQGVKHTINSYKLHSITMIIVGWNDPFSRKSQRDTYTLHY